MNISVIGTGYVGLVTGACFAEFGVHVTCMDTDERRIAQLDKGEIPIYEPGLAELVRKGLSEGRLIFTTDLGQAVETGLAIFIAVGTPSRELSGPLSLIEPPFVFTVIATAEMIKYASNAFLATKVSFINEVANLCERVGADVQVVAKAMGLDHRIGSKFLHAGPGYGGSCFPKDIAAMIQTGRHAGCLMEIAEATTRANVKQRARMVEKIKAAMGGSVAGKCIAVLGLTFKPNTNDLRDAPSLEIIPKLQDEGATIRAYDPAGMDEARKLLPRITLCANAYDAATGADALVLMTEWNQLRNLELEQIKRNLKAPVFVDLRNVYEPARMASLGFHYTSVGRPASRAKEGK